MEKVISLFPKQFEAFNFTSRFGLAVAGVQSGKTFVGAHWAATNMTRFPKKNGIIIAPTYNILRQATLAKLFQEYPSLRVYYKEQKGEIVLPTGGTVFVRSADKPLGVEGITADWIWLDEGGMTSQLTWTVLRSRVSMTGGQIFITTTPYNMGWLYVDFFQRFKAGEKDFSVFSWPSIANPRYPKEFFEAEKKRLPPEEFARRYMGEFRKMTGLVWDLPEDREIAPLEGLMVKAEARIIGVDWGFRNPAAIIVLYQRDGVWYVVDEWKVAERTTAEIIQVLHNKVKEHRVSRVYPDPAEPDRIEEARRAGIPVYDTNKDITGGVSFVKTLIYDKRFYVYNTCPETLAELSMYHYPEPKPGDETKEAKEEPYKFNDHLMDAMRYALYSHQPVKMNLASASAAALPYYPEIGL